LRQSDGFGRDTAHAVPAERRLLTPSFTHRGFWQMIHARAIEDALWQAVTTRRNFRPAFRNLCAARFGGFESTTLGSRLPGAAARQRRWALIQKGRGYLWRGRDQG